VKNKIKLVNIWQSCKHERDCLVHFLRLSAVCWPGAQIVKAVRGILMRECANLYKSMKIGTLVISDMLCPNLPGAKANSQWCRHIRQFKMAAA